MNAVPPTASRARLLVFGLVGVGLSLLALLVAFESALRIYHWLKKPDLPPVAERCLVPSDDRELVYELNAGWSREDFTVNSWGMADDELPVEKPDGVFRIAFVGDSITCNFEQRPRREIYLEILERELNARAAPGTRFECLNFGVNGYGILQELQVARTRASRFAPDLLVVQLGVNDPYPSTTDYGVYGPTSVLRTWDFLYRRLRPARFWAHVYVGRMYDAEGESRLRRGFGGFAEMAESGLPTVVVLFPYLYATAYESWGFTRYHELFAENAESFGLPLLDLYDAFSAGGLIDDTWPKDPIHPGAAGHRLAAASLLRLLESRDLLPPGRAAPAPGS
jgi:lysophospholipase L1-like esterase